MLVPVAIGVVVLDSVHGLASLVAGVLSAMWTVNLFSNTQLLLVSTLVPIIIVLFDTLWSPLAMQKAQIYNNYEGTKLTGNYIQECIIHSKAANQALSPTWHPSGTAFSPLIFVFWLKISLWLFEKKFRLKSLYGVVSSLAGDCLALLETAPQMYNIIVQKTLVLGCG